MFSTFAVYTPQVELLEEKLIHVKEFSAIEMKKK
jgi:hypothetical protein